MGEEIFSKEIECRLPNDVPYFTALSGGIDSSVLAYFISKTKTFGTKKFLDKKCN